ncbi:hypothetical protein CTA1_8914 [Colletotrichum tanaceti]|uniref:Uncharacterized protein n=1 Tax=Colletotrichum tanaceti TaxID=1306861 RepID=A0A4U6X0B0_9PEZI|nr:hypothetical protein CTA1_8914 [Colletotrichum tanaceti]
MTTSPRASRTTPDLFAIFPSSSGSLSGFGGPNLRIERDTKQDERRDRLSHPAYVRIEIPAGPFLLWDLNPRRRYRRRDRPPACQLTLDHSPVPPVPPALIGMQFTRVDWEHLLHQRDQV